MLALTTVQVRVVVLHDFMYEIHSLSSGASLVVFGIFPPMSTGFMLKAAPSSEVKKKVRVQIPTTNRHWDRCRSVDLAVASFTSGLVPAVCVARVTAPSSSASFGALVTQG